MNPFDRTLDLLQRKVELEGRSHAECVYLINESFRVTSNCIPHSPDSALEIEQLNRLKEVVNNLRSENMWMSAYLDIGDMLVHFQEKDTCIDMTVTLRQADVYNTLERSVGLAAKTLRDLCLMTNDNSGSITVNIGYAFANYVDMIYVEENTIDMGD
jgi:hypothetical protein